MLSLLAQVLPGVRELRLPVAVGSLWALALAVAYRLLPTAVNEQVHTAWDHQALAAQQLPTAAWLSLAGLGVYLFGVVAHELGRLLMRVLLALRTPAVVGLLVLAAASTVLLFLLVASFWACLLLLTAAVGVSREAYRRERRNYSLGSKEQRQAANAYFDSSGQGRLPFAVEFEPDAEFPSYLDWCGTLIRTWLRRLPAVVPGLAGALSDDLVTAWANSRDQVTYFVDEEAERYFKANPEQLQRLVSALPRTELSSASEAVGLAVSALEPISTLKNWGEVARLLRSIDAPDLQDVLRRRIAAALLGDVERRGRFLHKYVDLRDLRRDVARRVESAQVRLRAEQTSVYDEFDRLRAEGEFRAAVAPPIAAGLAALGLLVAREDVWVREHSWIISIAPLVVGGLLLMAGNSKSKQATALLYASVRQELVSNKDLRLFAPTAFELKGRYAK